MVTESAYLLNLVTPCILSLSTFKTVMFEIINISPRSQSIAQATRISVFYMENPLAAREYVVNHNIAYCGSDNIREVFIFANFVRRINSRIQKSLEFFYYDSATKENLQILNFVKNLKSKNSCKFKHAKIIISTVYILLLSRRKNELR